MRMMHACTQPSSLDSPLSPILAQSKYTVKYPSAFHAIGQPRTVPSSQRGPYSSSSSHGPRRGGPTLPGRPAQGGRRITVGSGSITPGRRVTVTVTTGARRVLVAMTRRVVVGITRLVLVKMVVRRRVDVVLGKTSVVDGVQTVVTRVVTVMSVALEGLMRLKDGEAWARVEVGMVVATTTTLSLVVASPTPGKEAVLRVTMGRPLVVVSETRGRPLVVVRETIGMPLVVVREVTGRLEETGRVTTEVWMPRSADGRSL